MDVYVMKDGRREGPYQPFRLREMLEEGTLTPLDSVWHEGMDNWQALGETESLRSVLRKEEVQPVLPDARTAPLPPARVFHDEEVSLMVMRARRAVGWRRFFARQIDIHLAIAIVICSLAALKITDVWSVILPHPWYLILVPAAVWIVVETVMLRFTGWTPGRLVLGLRVVRQDGGQLTLLQALQRSVLVWAGGLGFGLHPGYLLPVAQWIYGWWSLQKRGVTLWDHSSKTTVKAVRMTRWHVTGIALLLAVFTGLNVWLMLAAPLPDRLSQQDRTAIEELRQEFWNRD